jgi:hypothetical protein
MRERARPRRVVVVDAENPLQEISGEFYWREDHERILVQAREMAYAQGFADGSAAAQVGSALLARRVRRQGIGRAVVWALLVLIVLAFMVSLIGGILSSIHSP